jgi:RecJ-like exonuclease
MKRIILLAVLLIAAVAAWYGYREYTRTNKDLINTKPDFSFSATELIAAFEKDTASANRQYVDKIIAVTGNVKSIDTNGNPVVIALGEGTEMSSVQCSMDSTHAEAYRGVKEGDQLNLKGICTGGKTEELFGTDVILNRCVAIPKQ